LSRVVHQSKRLKRYVQGMNSPTLQMTQVGEGLRDLSIQKCVPAVAPNSCRGAKTYRSLLHELSCVDHECTVQMTEHMPGKCQKQ
jgi:hypothetical protein